MLLLKLWIGGMIYLLLSTSRTLYVRDTSHTRIALSLVLRIFITPLYFEVNPLKYCVKGIIFHSHFLYLY